MMEHLAGLLAGNDALSEGPMMQSLRIGGCRIDAAFAVPADPQASLSRESIRLAEQLMAGMLGADRDRVRVASLMPSGRPVAVVQGRPAGLSVSVSHVDSLFGAAVCPDGWVGLDIVDPATIGRGLDAWFTPDELALLPDDHGLVRSMLWAAKEAAFKAARLDTEFRPKTVAIHALSATGFTWTVRDPFQSVRGGGRFTGVARHVVALAAAVPVPAVGRSLTPYEPFLEAVPA